MTAINYNLLTGLRFKQIQLWNYLSYFKQPETLEYNFPIVQLKEVIELRKKSITIDDNLEYKRCRVQLYSKGIELRDEVRGTEIKTKRQQVCKSNDFLVAEIDAKSGGFGIVPQRLEGAIVSSHYFLYEINVAKLLPSFLELYIKTDAFFQQVRAVGSTNYAAIRPHHVLDYVIVLPDLYTQNQLVNQYNKNLTQAQEAENQANELENVIENYLLNELGIDATKPVERKQGLQYISLKEMNSWSIDKILYDGKNDFSQFQRLLNKINVENAFRGKSPKYEDGGEATILNQKCNRWNEIKLEFAKSVSKNWVDSIDDKFKTFENDVLINSTGDGTIGRSSLVTKEFEGLIYDSHVLLVRLNQNLIHPSFFVYQFNSAFIQSQIEQIKSAQSTKQTELGLDNLFKLNFKFPSLEIQTQIVNHITTQKQQIKNLRQQAEKLRKQAKSDFEKEIFV